MVVGQVEAAGFEVNNIDALHYSSTIWGWYLKWVEGGACPSSYLVPLLTCILFYRASPRLIPHLGLLPCLPHHRLTFLRLRFVMNTLSPYDMSCDYSQGHDRAARGSNSIRVTGLALRGKPYAICTRLNEFLEGGSRRANKVGVFHQDRAATESISACVFQGQRRRRENN